MEKDLFSIIEGQENEVRKKEVLINNDYIVYYRSLISALDISITKSIEYYPANNQDIDSKQFNILVTPKFISISKAAIDLALSGHPVETFTLSRLMLEISQVIQCLTFHPEYIKKYIDGTMHPKTLRKIIGKETKNRTGAILFESLSKYSHPTRELIYLSFLFNEKGLDIPIIIDNSELIRNAIMSIVLYVWTQYISYRSVFNDLAIANDKLRELDNYIFDMDRMNQLFGKDALKSIEKLALFIEMIDK
jgi:hypothetical protein